MPNSRIISTGRGGAGNLRQSQKDDEYEAGDNQLPQLQTKRFTTGRGGAGNMMDNVDPDSTRAAQDENETPSNNEPIPIKPSMSVGRGGYGNHIRNAYAQSESENKSFCEKLGNVF